MIATPAACWSAGDSADDAGHAIAIDCHAETTELLQRDPALIVLGAAVWPVTIRPGVRAS